MGFYQRHILPQLLNLAMRNGRLAPYRQRIIPLASGRVLEIGIGSGLNLPFYTAHATEILGLDPHPKLLAMASRMVSSVPAKIVGGSADSIPVNDATVDTVVTTWTLCTIPDVTAALREMRRVLKPGGQLLFVEHGLAPDDGVRRWQHRLTPLWKKFAGGCHLDRDVAGLIRGAGFEIAHLETGYMPGPKPMTFMYEGSARPAESTLPPRPGSSAAAD
jgi:ubiquinone/menaquinone biosynthesis C-methylase UbiE